MSNAPPKNPPRRPAHSAGPLQKCSRRPLEIDQKSDSRRSKIQTIFKSEKIALQEPVGAVWDPKNVSQSVPAVGNSANYEDAFFGDLGPTWPPKVSKMTPRWRPKRPQSDQKAMSKMIKILIEKKMARATIFGAARRHALASWGDF